MEDVGVATLFFLRLDNIGQGWHNENTDQMMLQVGNASPGETRIRRHNVISDQLVDFPFRECHAIDSAPWDEKCAPFLCCQFPLPTAMLSSPE